ncbi:putative phage associated protein [Neisseria gonorrhoeae]|uniref:Putative phage associated protein n=3 Tax=Neisseria TaxID=482 RepID=A0A378VXY7_NEIGO|nr:putative phage associated protein [Neisseria gonorrhoeae]
MRNKINRNDMELGYTPYNLRTLRNRCKLTQAELAQIVGVKHYIQVGRWEAEPDTETRRADMPLEKWRQFLDWIEKQTPSETFRRHFYPPPNLKTTTKPYTACPHLAAAPK